MGEDDESRKEVPVTADAVEDPGVVRLRREVRTVRAGESVRADVPFPVELRPAELAGPRRRS